jgi:hypothetical protein
MPALTLRGRYLMREYWSDSDLFLRLDAAQREFYVGLWMLADDEGWMPRDVPGIAGALFRFEDREPREAKVRSGLRRLADMGKVKSHRCGCLFLPAVARYPRAGKKSIEHGLTHWTHQTHSNGLADSGSEAKSIQTDLNPSPVPSLPVPTRPSAPAREGINPEPTKKGGLKDRFGEYSDVVKGFPK